MFLNSRHLLGACALLLAACTVVPTNIQMKNGSGQIHPVVNQLVIVANEERDLISLLRNAAGLLPSQTVAWTSSDTAVAFINPAGKVVGGKAGDAVLTGTVTGFMEPVGPIRIAIQVIEKHSVKLIQVQPPTPALVVGGRVKLTAQVSMADGQVNANVSWSSSDDTVATVNPTTGEASALRVGRVTIVATYTADPRYKAVAELLIVEDAASLPPSPAPSAIVFKPGSTPLPVAGDDDDSWWQSTILPSPTSKPTSSNTIGLATPTPAPTPEPTPEGPPSTQYAPPAGTTITNTGLESIRTAHFLDFDTVFVAGMVAGESIDNTVSYTTNAGQSWTRMRAVGSQTINVMYWLDANNGYVAGENGTILKVTRGNGEFQYEVQDSGTSSGISDIKFVDKNLGFAIANPYNSAIDSYLITKDGGDTWGMESFPPHSSVNRVDIDGLGRVSFFYKHWTGAGPLFKWSGSKATPVVLSGDVSSFSAVESAGNRTLVRAYGGDWYYTDDWNSFSKASRSLKTPTQILRDSLNYIYCIDKETWLANTGYGLCLTKNAGVLWSDPDGIDRGAGSYMGGTVKAFAADKFWHLDERGLLTRYST